MMENIVNRYIYFVCCDAEKNRDLLLICFEYQVKEGEYRVVKVEFRVRKGEFRIKKNEYRVVKSSIE